MCSGQTECFVNKKNCPGVFFVQFTNLLVKFLLIMESDENDHITVLEHNENKNEIKPVS